MSAWVWAPADAGLVANNPSLVGLMTRSVQGQGASIRNAARVFLTPENARLVAKAINDIVEPELALPAPTKLQFGGDS